MLYIKLFIEREKNIGRSVPECPFKTGVNAIDVRMDLAYFSSLPSTSVSSVFMVLYM